MAEEEKRIEMEIKTAIENERRKINTSVHDEGLFNIEINGQEITITGYKGFNDRTIIIPSTINGVEVTKIGYSAFENTLCEQVVIPESVTSIGSFAFRKCVKLESVVIGSGVLSIGCYAFAECEALKIVSLPEKLEVLDHNCFNSSGVMGIVIPPSVTTIPKSCFANCQNLNEVVIHEGVESIEDHAFHNCYKLTDLIIPNSVSVVDTFLISLNCNLVFLGTDTQWRGNRPFSSNEPTCKIYCRLGSAILQPARQSGCEVHPLSEYYEKR